MTIPGRCRFRGELAHLASQLLLGLLAHAARVEDDEIRVSAARPPRRPPHEDDRHRRSRARSSGSRRSGRGTGRTRARHIARFLRGAARRNASLAGGVRRACAVCRCWGGGKRGGARGVRARRALMALQGSRRAGSRGRRRRSCRCRRRGGVDHRARPPGRAAPGLVADSDAKVVRMLDTKTEQELRVTPLEGAPSQLVVAADGRVYVALRDRAEVDVLEVTPDSEPSLRVAARVATARSPRALSHADGRSLLVACGWATPRRLRDEDAGAQVRVGMRASRVGVTSEDGALAYVSTRRVPRQRGRPRGAGARGRRGAPRAADSEREGHASSGGRDSRSHAPSSAFSRRSHRRDGRHDGAQRDVRRDQRFLGACGELRRERRPPAPPEREGGDTPARLLGVSAGSGACCPGGRVRRRGAVAGGRLRGQDQVWRMDAGSRGTRATGGVASRRRADGRRPRRRDKVTLRLVAAFAHVTSMNMDAWHRPRRSPRIRSASSPSARASRCPTRSPSGASSFISRGLAHLERRRRARAVTRRA